jgi:two-component system, LytTR family, sensor kinase
VIIRRKSYDAYDKSLALRVMLNYVGSLVHQVPQVMKKSIINKVLVVVLHACGWALLFSLPYRFLSKGNIFLNKGAERIAMQSLNATIPFDANMLKVEALLSNTLLFIFFYTNMFVLIPRTLTKKGWTVYASLVFLCLGLYLTLTYYFRLHFVHFNSFRPPVLIGVPNFFMVFGLSLALRVMQDRVAYESILKERENEKLKSELSFLRSQVSPHFMFNVLNSLASLARKKSDHLESAIIQLSQLMRYSVYYTDKKVTLEQEADYITNYIELQKMRFGQQIALHFHVNIELKDLKIEPMLLIPFVENAFKHGVGVQNPVIKVALDTSGYEVKFFVKNKFSAQNEQVKDSSSGIGLQNVKRRLDLLYEDLYELKSYTKEEWFMVELKVICQ